MRIGLLNKPRWIDMDALKEEIPFKLLKHAKNKKYVSLHGGETFA